MKGFTLSPAAMQRQKNSRDWSRVAEMELGSDSLEEYHWLMHVKSAGTPTPRLNSLTMLIASSERSLKSTEVQDAYCVRTQRPYDWESDGLSGVCIQTPSSLVRASSAMREPEAGLKKSAILIFVVAV